MTAQEREDSNAVKLCALDVDGVVWSVLLCSVLFYSRGYRAARARIAGPTAAAAGKNRWQ